MPLESTCLTRLEDLADLEGRWEELRRSCGGSICTSYVLTLAWLRSFSKMVQPRVIVVEEGGSLVGIAPLCTQDYRVRGLRIRSCSLIGDISGKLGFSDLRVLCLPGRSDAIDEISAALDRAKWDSLRMSLLEDTEEDRRMLERARTLWDCQGVPESMTTVIDLRQQGQAEEVGRPRGEALDKRMRKMEKEGRLAFRAIPRAELTNAVHLYADHHVRRWAARGGSMFEDHENTLFLEEAITIAFDGGFGHAYELLIDGGVAAQCFGFTEGTEAMGFRMGMNPAYAKHSPGILLGTKFLEAMREQGVERVSLGYGSEDYKRNFGATESPLLGTHARKGWLSYLSRMTNSPQFDYIDRALGLRRRLFGDIYR